MLTATLVRALAERWWVWLLRGIVAILFAVLAFTQPGMTLAVLVLLYGAYALADGIFAVSAGVLTRTWGLILSGAFGIIAGILTFAYPGITALVLLYIIASWALLTGILEIIAAVRFRKEIENEWMLGISGALSVLIGLWMIARPGVGALSVIWLIGFYALLSGILMVALSLRLRGLRARLAPAP
jgi:uncharacterized membrane protein HdeD (DUF308 family)